MEIHGICSLDGETSDWVVGELKLLGCCPQKPSNIAVQRCTRGKLWSIAIRSNDRALPARQGTRNLSMSDEKKQYRIAVIPGDGIGKEVGAGRLARAGAAAKKHGVGVHFDHFDFASWIITKSTAR